METVLLLSAGKDSAACLWLLQDLWDQMEIVWVNPGEPDPSAAAYIETIAKQVPHFREVTGKLEREDDPWKCCGKNRWPLFYNTIFDGKVKHVISGVKACDPVKSSTHRPGLEFQGVKYHFPIWDWTDADVFWFLGDKTPPSYKKGLRTSLDCANCTLWEKYYG